MRTFFKKVFVILKVSRTSILAGNNNNEEFCPGTERVKAQLRCILSFYESIPGTLKQYGIAKLEQSI